MSGVSNISFVEKDYQDLSGVHYIWHCSTVLYTQWFRDFLSVVGTSCNMIEPYGKFHNRKSCPHACVTAIHLVLCNLLCNFFHAHMGRWVYSYIHVHVYTCHGFYCQIAFPETLFNIIFVQSRGHCLSCIYTSWYKPGLSLHKHGNQQNCYYVNYHKISNIRRTESQHLNDSHLVLQLSVPNPLKPGAKPRMKM